MRFAIFLMIFFASAGTLVAQTSTSVNATINTNTYQSDQNTAAPTTNQQISAPVAYKYLEQMPAFPGDLTAFIGKNLVYPDSALKAGIAGQIIIQFMVKKDGTLSNIEIVRKVHPMLEKEALRLMSVMPRWIPGKSNGQTVDAMFMLPITFNPE